MRIYTLFITLAFIFYSLECSSHSDRNPYSGRDSGPFPPARQHQPDQYFTPEESLIRERSVSPPYRFPSDQLFGCSMEQLGYIRLIPRKNQNRRFELRKYVFPSDKTIRLKTGIMSYTSVGTTEYIVLSTSNSEVFAIMDHDGFLRGIYQGDRNHSRIKISMISGAVDNMTPSEKTDCPVGKRRVIFPNNYIRAFADFDSLQINYHSDRERNPGTSSSAGQHSPGRSSPQEPSIDVAEMSPPGRPPSDEVFGYPLEELGFIRLIPRTNPHRQFEFRRYVFPVDKNIRVMTESNKYVPAPDREHLVLSTSSGEVFAILEYTGILRGIYKAKRYRSRIRINMISGEVNIMTSSEMKECHVGKTYPIFPRWFDKVVSNEDSLQYVYH